MLYSLLLLQYKVHIKYIYQKKKKKKDAYSVGPFTFHFDILKQYLHQY